MKAGNSAQNSTPGVRSKPGHEPSDTPTQGAWMTACKSYRPKGADAKQPTTIPMMGDHRRHEGGPRITSTAMTSKVESAAIGAAIGDEPSGTSFRLSNMIGITVTAMSMMTVPETTGLNTRRSRDRRDASRNWKSEDMTIRLAIVAGPPSTSAVTQTAKNAPDVPMTRTCPAPMRQKRAACKKVVIPLTISAANIAQGM